MRSLLADRLKGRPTRANFRTGHLTVCTLVPMRSIPHRVVCLLGLDDGSFPRHIERDGDDLTRGRPGSGDRDARSEDRQLLLDALLAAREHLVITYIGRDERSNLQRPPAVPVGELLDVVDHTVRGARRNRAREAVVVAHPLQPFDARNFERGRARRVDGPWSFDPLHLAGARAAARRRTATARLPGAALPARQRRRRARPAGAVRAPPSRAFLRQRLGISLWDRTRDFEDAIPIELDALEQWDIGERMLQARWAERRRTACRPPRSPGARCRRASSPTRC